MPSEIEAIARPEGDLDAAGELEDTAVLLDRPRVSRQPVEPDAPRVLVVDDLETNRRLTLLALESLGCWGEAVTGGRAALAALETGEYQLVLMDCQMPDLDGYETTRRIRRGEADGASRRIPVIAVTAHGGEWEREKCLAAGMDDYLAKPFHSRELAAVLERWLPAVGGPEPGRPEPGAGIAPAESAVATAGSDGSRDEGAEILDPGTIEILKQLGKTGREDLASAVASYREDGEKHLAVMRQAIHEHDAPALAGAAHKLAGSSGFLGASILAMLCREVQDLAKRQDLTGCDERIPSIEEGYRRLVMGLERSLGGPAE